MAASDSLENTLSTILTQPWQPLKIGEKIYMAKIHFPKEESYSILLSDVVTVWDCQAKERDIVDLCQTLNPTIDAPPKTILRHLRSAFNDVTTTGASFSLDQQIDFCELTMTSQLAGFPFKWKFFLTEAGKEKFSDHVTVPMMMLVSELRRQQMELIKLLRDKDAEIENYQMQGYKVTRKNIETKIFDENKFQKQTAESKSFEQEVVRLGQGILSPPNQELYRNVMTKKALLDEDSGSEITVSQSWTTGPISAGTSSSPGKRSPVKPLPQKDVSDETELTEIDRRRALKEKLAREEQKLEEKQRKKRKLKL